MLIHKEHVEMQVLLIWFNDAALIMLVLAFGTAFGRGTVTGFSTRGHFMAIAGPLIILSDLGYRLSREHGHWIDANRGGSLLGFPLWPFGVLWLGLGVYYLVTGA
jgi:hypothetical protein